MLEVGCDEEGHGEEGPGWDVALTWNIIPAGIGNLIGGTFFVALAIMNP